MTRRAPVSPSEFDAYAEDYDEQLKRGLAVSGEGKEFFAQGRVAWLQRRLDLLAFRPRTALDFGCGVGTSTGSLLRLKGVEQARGVDVSEKSIEVARSRVVGVEFGLVSEYAPAGENDLVFCNGVFHHIAIGERAKAARYVWECLRPGGLFAFCDNNPWNPGTRWVMSRIEFDRDAVLMSAPQARRLLAGAGFEVLSTDFLFFFPRLLKGLRGLEPLLRGLPLGGQFMVIARRAG